MVQVYTSPEELAADEGFLSWYFKTSAEAVRAWEDVLARHPQYRLLNEEAVLLMQELEWAEAPVPAAQTEAALERLKTAAGVRSVPAPVVPLRARGRRLWIPAAAVLLAAVLGGYFLWPRASTPQLWTSGYGELVTRRLPDGSEVVLNANSKLTVKEQWEEGSSREVWLEGEAFFHVRKAGGSRFVVHAPEFDIVVTGTQFNVRTRGDQPSVLLTEGSVTVNTRGGKTLHLQPGQSIQVSGPAGLVLEAGKAEAALAWKERKLFFDNTPMEQVARQITELYGLPVQLPEASVAQKTVSGIMPNDNLDILLRSLEATTDFRIERRPDGIVVLEP
ncbi:MAG TPA: FecR domain-containing protein [Chitinophagaceae bacterium]|nr:FecR domain-containing protein [Chitinophagaceae bacterium]